ncbi:MAG: hypothetical protein D6706_21800, partial [Chloroflexi bacterium]
MTTLVRLKPGCYYGKDKQHQPGDIIEFTDEELASFGDKVTIVTDNPGRTQSFPQEEEQTAVS